MKEKIVLEAWMGKQWIPDTALIACSFYQILSKYKNGFGITSVNTRTSEQKQCKKRKSVAG